MANAEIEIAGYIHSLIDIGASATNETGVARRLYAPAITGALTNNGAAPAATTLLGVISALANAAAPSWTEGRAVLLSSDLSGNQRATLGTLLSGENQTFNRLMTLPSYSFLNVAAGLATTVAKSGAGVLRAVTINTKGAASNTLTIWDNTAGSGTKIAVIDTTVAATTLYFDAAVGTGITLVSATGTGCDYTVTFI